MSELTLNATLRSDEQQGKGASRRLRREGVTPAIVYGGAKNRKPASISVLQKDILRALDNEAFYSSIIELNIGDKKENVVLIDLQRHPAKDIILHADFLRVSKTTKITKKIPLHFVNEDSCQGVKIGGGKITKLVTEVSITCTASLLPAFLELDMLEIEAGAVLHISDIVLPKGAESSDLSLGHDLAIASVSQAKGKQEDGEGEEEA